MCGRVGLCSPHSNCTCYLPLSLPLLLVHAPCPFPVYLDWCRPLVAGSVVPKFPTPFCLFASDIYYYLFIDILYFFLFLTPISFIRYEMESCFVVPFSLSRSSYISCQPATISTGYITYLVLLCLHPILPLPCLFSVFFFLHTCAHCAPVLVTEPNSCLDVL